MDQTSRESRKTEYQQRFSKNIIKKYTFNIIVQKGILAEATDLKQKNISQEDLKQDILKYLETDTLFYWYYLGSELRLKQEFHWGNALNIFALKMDVPTLKFTDTLFGLQQDNLVVIKFIDFLKELDYFQLASIKSLFIFAEDN